MFLFIFFFQGDIYVERWLGIPKMKRLVKYKKHKTESNVQQGKGILKNEYNHVNTKC